MTGAWARLGTPVQNALDALSVRARFGLVVLGAIGGIYALLMLNDANVEAQRALDMAQRQLAARQGALEQRDWTALAAEVDALAQAAEARFWRAATPGIAAARIQGALEAAAREAGLNEVRVRVVEAGVLQRHTPGPDVRLFEAEVSARDRGGAFAPFIEAAAGAPGELRAVRLDWDSRTQRFTVVLIAPALLEAGS